MVCASLGWLRDLTMDRGMKRKPSKGHPRDVSYIPGCQKRRMLLGIMYASSVGKHYVSIKLFVITESERRLFPVLQKTMAETEQKENRKHRSPALRLYTVLVQV